MFKVQETANAYGPNDTIPENAWRTISPHRELRIARDKKHELDEDMRDRCGPTAWDSHRRIVTTRDYQRRREFFCAGYLRADGRCYICGNVSPSVLYTWPAGKIEPRPEPPEGWTHTQCPACHQAEQKANQRRFDWRFDAEKAATDLRDELETQQDAIGG